MAIVGSVHRLNPYRLLRSRRLAIWLITALGAYMALVAAVPQGSMISATVSDWQTAHPYWADVTTGLGLHRAYAQPWFLLAAGLLIASLVACSWERTVGALREWRRFDEVPPSDHGAWRQDPIALHDGLPADVALSRVAEAFTTSRLRVSPAADGLRGVGNRWGVIGSPLFHWTLVLLFASAALSQATKAEGVMAITHGTSKAEVADSYGPGLYTGPLFPGHRENLSISVSEAVDGLVVDEVDRGYAPRVQLAVDGREVRDHYVFSNRPLRYGGITVHEGDGFGPSLRVRLASRTAQPTTLDLPFVRNEAVQYGIEPYMAGYTGGDGVQYVLRIEARPDKRMAVFARPESQTGWALSEEIGLDGSIELPGGVNFDPISFGTYSLLIVANDPFMGLVIGALLAVGVVVIVPLFFPPRVVWARIQDGRLQLVVRTRRIDPAFANLMRKRVTMAVGSNQDVQEDL